MSAAARGAAGFLFLAGRLRRPYGERDQFIAERAAVQLRREREKNSQQVRKADRR